MANLNLEAYNPDKVEYVVWTFGEGEPEINIDGRELVYSQLGKTHHGVQCMVSGEDEEKHNKILGKMKQIAELFREVNELNK